MLVVASGQKYFSLWAVCFCGNFYSGDISATLEAPSMSRKVANVISFIAEDLLEPKPSASIEPNNKALKPLQPYSPLIYIYTLKIASISVEAKFYSRQFFSRYEGSFFQNQTDIERGEMPSNGIIFIQVWDRIVPLVVVTFWITVWKKLLKMPLNF